MTDEPESPESTGPIQEPVRGPDGKFLPGASGNPAGRPPGARNRSTQAALELLEGEAQAITKKAIDLALAGDIQAIRLCLERLLPRLQATTTTLNMPQRTLADMTDQEIRDMLGHEYDHLFRDNE